MNATSPAVRSLQVAAVALGIATVVLFTMWLRRQSDGAPLQVAEAAASARGATLPAPEMAATSLPPIANTVVATENAAEATPTIGSGRAVLIGTVKRADGTFVDRGFVFLEGGGNGQGLDHGTFAMADLQPGAREVRTRIDDELPLQQTVDVVAPRTRVDLVLPAKWLLTVNAVTADGEPLNDALRKTGLGGVRGLRAAAFEDPPAKDSFPSNSGELQVGVGVLRANDMLARRDKPLPKQTVGVLTLPPGRAVHVALLLEGAIVATMPASPDQSKITFTIAPDAVLAKTASVRLRAVDANGTAIAGVKIALSGGGSYGGGTATDEDGRVTLSKLLPGRLGLRVVGDKRQARPIEFVPRCGEILDLGDVVLLEPTTVEFAIESAAERRTILITCLEPSTHERLVPLASNLSGIVGNTFPVPLTPGRHGVHVRTVDGCALLEVDTRALPPQPIRVVLQPAAKLLVQNRVGTGWKRVVVRTAAGIVVLDSEMSGRWETTLQVPAGTYDVVLAGLGGTTTKQLNVAASGATLVVE